MKGGFQLKQSFAISFARQKCSVTFLYWICLTSLIFYVCNVDFYSCMFRFYYFNCPVNCLSSRSSSSSFWKERKGGSINEFQMFLWFLHVYIYAYCIKTLQIACTKVEKLSCQQRSQRWRPLHHHPLVQVELLTYWESMLYCSLNSVFYWTISL